MSCLEVSIKAININNTYTDHTHPGLFMAHYQIMIQNNINTFCVDLQNIDLLILQLNGL